MISLCAVSIQYSYSCMCAWVYNLLCHEKNSLHSQNSEKWLYKKCILVPIEQNVLQKLKFSYDHVYTYTYNIIETKCWCMLLPWGHKNVSNIPLYLL